MKAKIVWQKIKCFFGFHEYQRLYFMRKNWSRTQNKHTLEIQCYECKNCKKPKSISHEI